MAGRSGNTVLQQQGFTLVEMVMVIVISAILAVLVTSFISRSVQGLVASSQRLELASNANLISERISREIRSALPNSVRTFDDGNNSCIEFVPIINSSEYLTLPVVAAANQFTVVALPAGGNTGFVAVYPSSVAQVYDIGSNTVTQVQASAAPAVANVQTVSFAGGANVRFDTHSPTHRFYLTAQPVAFCEDTNGRVWRYVDYGFHADSRAFLPPAVANRAVVGAGLQPGSLSFNLLPAQLQRNAVVRVSLTAQSAGGESLASAQEVQLRNVP